MDSRLPPPGLSGIAFSLLAIALLPIGTQRLQVGSFLFTAALTLTLACLWLTLSANRMLQLFLYATLYGSFWVSKITTYVLPSEVYRVEVRARRTPPWPRVPEPSPSLWRAHLRSIAPRFPSLPRPSPLASTLPRPAPQVRSTLNGISAACGKLGAILGSAVFDSILRSADKGPGGGDAAVQRVLFVSVVFSLSGALLTLVGLGAVSCCPPRRGETTQLQGVQSRGQYTAVR